MEEPLDPDIYYDANFRLTTKDKAVYADRYVWKDGHMVVETIVLSEEKD